jgi:serine protease Do
MQISARKAVFFGCVLAAGAFAPLVARRAPDAVANLPVHPKATSSVVDTASIVAFHNDSMAAAQGLQDTVSAGRRTAIVRAAERVSPAVVSVTVTVRESVVPRTFLESLFIPPGASQESQGLGSGSIIDPRGLVLTNEHVVRGATEIYVTLRDGRRFKADLAGSDDVTDLALLRLKNVTGQLPVAPLGTSRDLLVGEWAIAIGNPFGYLLSNAEPTVTAGVISGLNRNIISSTEDNGSDESGGYYLDMIQTDASINPGNSGGPLVNALGQVIGVNSSIISGQGGSIGLGFAIPIDRAKRVAADLLRDGRVRRVFTGVDLKDVAPDTSGRPASVQVASVAQGSPGAIAGIRSGMTLIRAGGRAIHTRFDWEAQLLDSRVGETFDVVVSDGGQQRTVRIAPQDLPSLSASRVKALDIFTLITLTPAIKAERKLRSNAGALIVNLTDDARSIGLRDGDLIVDINRTRIESAEEAANMLARLRGTGITVRMTIEREGQLGAFSFNIGR